MTMFRRNVKGPASGSGMRWVMLGAAIIAAFSTAGFIRETLRARQIDHEIASLKSESDSLRAKNLAMASLQNGIGQDAFAEREARLNLNLKKAGEHVVVIASAAPATTAPASVRIVTDQVPLSNPRKWWLYFTDHIAYVQYAAAARAAN